MTLRKREATWNYNTKHQIALCGQAAWEGLWNCRESEHLVRIHLMQVTTVSRQNVIMAVISSNRL